jgi:hypothetical protein
MRWVVRIEREDEPTHLERVTSRGADAGNDAGVRVHLAGDGDLLRAKELTSVTSAIVASVSIKFRVFLYD